MSTCLQLRSARKSRFLLTDDQLGSVDHCISLNDLWHWSFENSVLAVDHGISSYIFRALARVALALSGLMISFTASACVCPKPEFNAAALDDASIVVGGTVTAARIEDSRLFVEVRTSVVWKGLAQAHYSFTADVRNNCSISHITVGGYYVFFTGEAHRLSHCSYTYQPGSGMSDEEAMRRHQILYSLPHVRMDD